MDVEPTKKSKKRKRSDKNPNLEVNIESVATNPNFRYRTALLISQKSEIEISTESMEKN